MLENIDAILLEHLKKAIYLIEQNNVQISTTVLLLGLLEYDESVLNYVLKNQNIDSAEIRKMIFENTTQESPDALMETFTYAKEIAANDRSNIIYDEHLLYALLIQESTSALNILLNIGVDIDSILDSVCDFFEETNDEIHLDNLTKKAQENKLEPFVGRKYLIDKIVRILAKKQKNNCILIGNAGVGKSALVEGVAQYLAIHDKSKTIYRLDITSLIAGTKYRGDLEERLMKILEYAKKPNTIIFIDEIHNIINANDNSLDIANILKPALARGEIKCIGATTTEEYYQVIEKDKALMRRFENVFINESNIKETNEILNGIKKNFESFHNVKYSRQIISYIIEISKMIPNRRFPDKAIDIMDEAGIIASRMNIKEVRKSDVLKVVLEMNGLINQQFKNLNYPILIPYYQNYLNAMMRNTLVNINASCEHLPFLYDDFSKIFNVTDEAILEINLEEYNAPHMNSMLIGSPPGYVGYENGGILTEHILKYPIAIVALKNYDLASPVIQSQIKSFVEEGKVIDAKGRKIYFANTIFIFISKTNAKNVGFIAQKKQEETFFDITIDQDVNYYCKLQTLFKHYAIHNYFFRTNLKKITYKQFTLIRNFILKTSNFKKHQRYLITLNDEKIAIEKT